MCIRKMMWIKMGDERLTEGSIYDINVACYNSQLVRYTTSMSHTNELSEIACWQRYKLRLEQKVRSEKDSLRGMVK